MKIGKEIEFVDRCLLLNFNKKRTLVVGDLHLGKENLMLEQGWSFPKTQLEKTIKIFNLIFKKIGNVDEIILLGDVKEFFGGILKDEFSDFWKVVNLLKKSLNKNGKIVITKGNHDNILEPIVRNYDFVELRDYYILSSEKEGILFLHGHKKGFENLKKEIVFYDKKIKTIVCGHFHPAISIKDSGGVKKENFKCFLFGKNKYFKKDFLVVPSFFPLVEGTNILINKKELSENLNIKSFNIYVVFGDDKLQVKKFGKVKDFLND